MSVLRALVAVLVVIFAAILQVSVFSHLAWQGIVPNLVLLVVVGAALMRGPQFATLLGFVAGLALDLAPPADHIAGRWALALVIVGYLVGQIRENTGRQEKPAASAVVVAVAAASFVATSIYAFSGMLLGDPATNVSDMLITILVAVIWDVVLTPFVLPPVMLLFGRLRPARVAF